MVDESTLIISRNKIDKKNPIKRLSNGSAISVKNKTTKKKRKAQRLYNTYSFHSDSKALTATRLLPIFLLFYISIFCFILFPFFVLNCTVVCTRAGMTNDATRTGSFNKTAIYSLTRARFFFASKIYFNFFFLKNARNGSFRRWLR